MNNQSNIIILGTGPISLIKCHLLLKNSNTKKIILIDSKNEIGGAWHSDKKNTYDLETGCHIWSYCPEVYDYISKEFGIELSTFETKPIFIRNNFKLNYEFKNTIDSYKYLFKNLIKLNISVFKEIKASPKYYLNLFNKSILYPKKGSPEFIKKLTKHVLNDNRVELILNTKVESISTDYIEIKNKKINYDKLFLTSTSTVNEISSTNKKLNINGTTTNYVHFKISLNNPPLKTASYYRVTNSDFIHRISDISYQTEKKEHILLVAIFDDGFKKHDNAFILNKIKDKLINFSIISPEHELKLEYVYEFPTFYISGELRNKINAFSDQIKLLHSTDLMHGIYYLLQEESLI